MSQVVAAAQWSKLEPHPLQSSHYDLLLFLNYLRSIWKSLMLDLIDLYIIVDIIISCNQVIPVPMV